jgi:predicted  nucleic acid-binding Zn-ribbon protein
MNSILQNLLKLQALEFGEIADKSVEAQVAELRGNIPQPILGHYDRLRVRGKKGVAVVRNQVCTGCHMHVPIGQITVVMRGEDVQLCETCGRYLYLPDPAEAEALVLAEAAKPAAAAAAKAAAKAAKAPAKPRKRRALVPVA